MNKTKPIALALIAGLASLSSVARAESVLERIATVILAEKFGIDTREVDIFRSQSNVDVYELAPVYEGAHYFHRTHRIPVASHPNSAGRTQRPNMRCCGLWEAHLWMACRINYIHVNPVRKGLCETPEDWPWTSYRAYLDPPNDAGLVTRFVWQNQSERARVDPCHPAAEIFVPPTQPARHIPSRSIMRVG